MSYIDSYKHELLGLFGNIPVYHPLEDIPPSENPCWDGDYGCTTGQIVIGGGSGEHPGLVLCNSAAAVAEFVLATESFEAIDSIKSRLYPMLKAVPLLFAGWNVDDYHGFYELCISKALPHPFDDETDLSFEKWLLAGLDKFIYYALPHLAQETVDLVGPLHTEKTHIFFNNIGVVPSNMPVYANGGNVFFKD